ncbi:MAG: hypothetical protein C4325_13000 [Blastocatellia bacterium]
MNKLYACITVSGDEKQVFSAVEVAKRFAYRIEVSECTVLFDISGLEKRIGSPKRIAAAISQAMKDFGLKGTIAIAPDAGIAELHARSQDGITVIESESNKPLALEATGIGGDTLSVFRSLGFETTEDVARLPEDQLIERYGPQFRKILDIVNGNSGRILTSNLEENFVSWDYKLDFPIEDFGQLIFILGHGLGSVLREIEKKAYSTEKVEAVFQLENGEVASYCLKLSFPTLNQKFWLRLINLRISKQPPAAGIVSIRLICHFAAQRSIARGLFSASQPEPEDLLVTIAKIKNLVGEDNVGVPVLLNQRLPEAFVLDSEKVPVGKKSDEFSDSRPTLAFSYFRPPLRADVHISSNKLARIKTRYFSAEVIAYSGVWVNSSSWWTREYWQKMEWDVELEGHRLLRLALTRDGWFVTGGYD